MGRNTFPLYLSGIMILALGSLLDACTLADPMPHGYPREFAIMPTSDLINRFLSTYDTRELSMAIQALDVRLEDANANPKTDPEIVLTYAAALNMYEQGGKRAHDLLAQKYGDSPVKLYEYRSIWYTIARASKEDPLRALSLMKVFAPSPSWPQEDLNLYQQWLSEIRSGQSSP